MASSLRHNACLLALVIMRRCCWCGAVCDVWPSLWVKFQLLASNLLASNRYSPKDPLSPRPPTPCPTRDAPRAPARIAGASTRPGQQGQPVPTQRRARWTRALTPDAAHGDARSGPGPHHGRLLPSCRCHRGPVHRGDALTRGVVDVLTGERYALMLMHARAAWRCCGRAWGTGARAPRGTVPWCAEARRAAPAPPRVARVHA